MENKKNWAVFISGILSYDAVNHLVLIVKGSVVSVHGVHVGIMGNWIVLAVDIVLVMLLLLYVKKLNPKTD